MKRDISEKEIKKILKNTNRSDEQKEVKKFIVILLAVCILIIGVYFLTKNIIEKKQAKAAEANKTEVTFDYNKIILGELLNRPYEEYYVMVYSIKEAHANYYSGLANKYASTKGDDALKVYTADLDDTMNKKFYNKKESNPQATSVDELKVKDLTLIKVKNGKIVKYLEDTDSIRKEFGI